MLTSANTSRTVRSVLEAPVGQPVIHLQDLWLARRLLTSESEEADLVLVKINVTADQAVGPQLAKRPAVPQQRHLTHSVGSPQVDHPAVRALLQMELPVPRERSTVWGGLDPRCSLPHQRRDVPLGMPLQVLQVGMLEAGPDLGLPPAVVTLDHGLEAGLPRRHEDRHHVQTQTQADDPPQGIRVTVGAV